MNSLAYVAMRNYKVFNYIRDKFWKEGVRVSQKSMTDVLMEHDIRRERGFTIVTNAFKRWDVDELQHSHEWCMKRIRVLL